MFIKIIASLFFLVLLVSCGSNEISESIEEQKFFYPKNGEVKDFFQDKIKLNIRLDSIQYNEQVAGYFLAQEGSSDLNFDSTYYISYSLSSSQSDEFCYYSMLCSIEDFIKLNNENYTLLHRACFQNGPMTGRILQDQKFFSTLVIQKNTDDIDTLSLQFLFYPVNCGTDVHFIDKSGIEPTIITSNTIEF